MSLITKIVTTFQKIGDDIKALRLLIGTLSGLSTVDKTNLVNAINELKTNVDGKASTSHIHDDRYFTETEVNSLLLNKEDKAIWPKNKIYALGFEGETDMSLTGLWDRNILTLNHLVGSVTFNLLSGSMDIPSTARLEGLVDATGTVMTLSSITVGTSFELVYDTGSNVSHFGNAVWQPFVFSRLNTNQFGRFRSIQVFVSEDGTQWVTTNNLDDWRITNFKDNNIGYWIGANAAPNNPVDAFNWRYVKFIFSDYIEGTSTNPSLKNGAAFIQLGIRHRQEEYARQYQRRDKMPTTLSGYGITDAYTKAESDNKYLTTETDPTVPVYTKTLNSANKLLTEIKLVDGVGSGLDADLLDGMQPSALPISTATQTALDNKENSFSKNTAFNKNFGTTAGTVAEGNHTHSIQPPLYEYIAINSIPQDIDITSADLKGAFIYVPPTFQNYVLVGIFASYGSGVPTSTFNVRLLKLSTDSTSTTITSWTHPASSRFHNITGLSLGSLYNNIIFIDTVLSIPTNAKGYSVTLQLEYIPPQQ